MLLKRPPEVEEFLSDYVSAKRKSLVRRDTNKMLASEGDLQILLEAFSEVSESFKGRIVPASYSLKKSKTNIKRIVNLFLSDTHFQANLKREKCGFEYGSHEEARRLAKVCIEAAEFKKQYRDNSALFLHIGGDMMQGQLHHARDGAPLAIQMAATADLLSQAVGFLAAHFPEVEVGCAVGNHGRNTAVHKSRAIHDKYDSLEWVVYDSVRRAASNLKNVKFHLNQMPFYTYKAFDQHGFVSHGDTVMSPGRPNKSVNVLGLTKKVNAWKVSGAEHAKCRLFALAHVHIGSLVRLPDNTTLLTNGALTPPDEFAITTDAFGEACGQYCWESVEGHIVGDVRFLTVDAQTDKDASLEKIIKPVKYDVW